MTALVLAACTSGPDPEGGPRIVGEPSLASPAEYPLSRVLTVETDVPTRLSFTIDDGVARTSVAFPTLSRQHTAPVLGMGPDRDVTVEVRVMDAYERETTLALAPFRTDPLPPDFPRIDILALDPDRVEPGWRFLPLEADDGEIWLAALRADSAEVGWLYTGPINWGDVRVTADGTIVGLFAGAWEVDLVGTPIGRWSPVVDEPGELFIPWTLTHEVWPRDADTFVSLAFWATTSPSYPESYEDPTPGRPAEIQEEHVVAFDRAGNVVFDWSLAERLDPSRIGFGSLEPGSLGLDWSHANAVIPMDDGFLVSVRHQDVLVKLDATGEVEWMLGDPLGWAGAHQDLLLTPEPGIDWAYHHHGPSLDGDGHIVVLDNHNYGHTPYGPAPAEPVETRVVAFAVDEGARTVRQAWEWKPPGGLYSAALGNATWLPRTGNVVAGFNFLDGEDGIVNQDVGRGYKSMRVFEIHPGEAEPVSDLRLWTPIDESPAGIRAYRTVPAPSLYAADVQVTAE